MRDIPKYWWIALIVTVILRLFSNSAWDEVAAYENYYEGWQGVAEGFVAGYTGDYGKVGRVENQYYDLIDDAKFWRMLYRISLLATLILAGVQIRRKWLSTI